MVMLEQVSLAYSQEPDCCGDAATIINELKVSTFDGGGGPYLVIETKRWAIDNLAELVAVLQRALDLHGTPAADGTPKGE